MTDQATNTAWENFLSYLREEYGTTKRQQAGALLDGIRRDGRRPSQFLAKVVEKTKDLTIDDIRKEVILRDLPPQVCHALAAHAKNSTAEELAKLADDYFDRDGQHLHSSAATVNNINSEEMADADGDGDDINAVGSGRSWQRGKAKPPFQPRKFTPAFQPTSSASNQPPSRQPPQQQQQQQSSGRHSSPPLCHAHKKFGDSAYTCRPGCIHFSTFKENPKAQAGRRA